MRGWVHAEDDFDQGDRPLKHTVAHRYAVIDRAGRTLQMQWSGDKGNDIA